MFNPFKKKSREQQVQDRCDAVFLQLIKDVEFEFTELETVQILNSVRRMKNDWLQGRKNASMEQSLHFNQKAKEIAKALEYLE